MCLSAELREGFGGIETVRNSHGSSDGVPSVCEAFAGLVLAITARFSRSGAILSKKSI